MKISFVGDLSATGEFYSAIEHNKLSVSTDLCNVFLNSDFTVANLEGPTTTSKNVFGARVSVISPINTISFFAKKKINVFNLANNHTFDAGIAGFLDTKNNIMRNNCQFFGAGENVDEASKLLILEKGEVKIGLIGVGDPGEGLSHSGNYDEGAIISDMNVALIKKLIARSNSIADWTVLNFHNGTEFNFYPIKYVREKLKRFIDFGADIIIAHHPHVPQGIEKYNTGVIFYSLGNFLFDLQEHKNKKYTNLSLIVTIDFNKSSYDYSFLLSKCDSSKNSIEIVKDRKVLNWFNKLNYYTNSKIIGLYAFGDLIRTIFFNPIFFNRKLANALIFLTVFLKPIMFLNGGSKELLRDFLNYLRLGFLMKLINTQDMFTKDQEY